MAADLARLPQSGLLAQLCGDAHVQNMGSFASQAGNLIFDLNDFDETIRGPWEWDVKRMATSIILAGREAGQNARCAARPRRFLWARTAFRWKNFLASRSFRLPGILLNVKKIIARFTR